MKAHLYRKATTLLLVISALNLSSCMRILARTVLGVDVSPNIQSDIKVKKVAKRLNIPEGQLYILDTTYANQVRDDFKEEFTALKAEEPKKDSIELMEYRKVFSDNMQSTQLRYFTPDGQPIFKIVNCYVDPPIPMRWNVNGCFDVFPPAIADEALTKGNRELDFFLQHIRTIDGKTVSFSELPKTDYYAVIFWNSFFKRPSKKLIKQVRRYNKRNPGQTTHFLFVNNHNSQIWDHIDAAKRIEVLELIKKKNLEIKTI